MKYLVSLTLLLFVGFIAQSQSFSDYLIDKNDKKVFCQIKQIKNGKVKYKLRGKSYSINEYLIKYKDIHFSNPKVLKNQLNISIETPADGYAHVYFFYGDVHFSVKYNDEHLVTIGSGAYYLHKIKANEKHTYTSTDYTLEIDATEKSIYYVRGKSAPSKFNGLSMSYPATKLVQKKNKVIEYSILSMRRQAEASQ